MTVSPDTCRMDCTESKQQSGVESQFTVIQQKTCLFVSQQAILKALCDLEPERRTVPDEKPPHDG